MKCPRDESELVEKTIAGVTIDVCQSCGGIWFDNFEVKSFDEEHETAGDELLLLIEQFRTTDVDLTKQLTSPRHSDIVMQRRFWSPAKQIEIDQCPKSGGLWLDGGELAQLRALFATEEERQAACKALVADVVENSSFAEEREASQEALKNAEQVYSFFRFICPSFWLSEK